MRCVGTPLKYFTTAPTVKCSLADSTDWVSSHRFDPVILFAGCTSARGTGKQSRHVLKTRSTSSLFDNQTFESVNSTTERLIYHFLTLITHIILYISYYIHFIMTHFQIKLAYIYIYTPDDAMNPALFTFLFSKFLIYLRSLNIQLYMLQEFRYHLIHCRYQFFCIISSYHLTVA